MSKPSIYLTACVFPAWSFLSCTMPLTRRQTRRASRVPYPFTSPSSGLAHASGLPVNAQPVLYPAGERKRVFATIRIKPHAVPFPDPNSKPSPAAVKSQPDLPFSSNVKVEQALPPANQHINKKPKPEPTLSKEEPQLQPIVSHPDIEDLPRVPTHDEAREIRQILRNRYSPPFTTEKHPKAKPRQLLLDTLIATILSQATNNANSSRAFTSLKAQFPDWESALAATPQQIEQAIKCGGLAPAKSKVIHNILTQLKQQQGQCSLEHVRDMNTDDAKKALCAFKGVGPKTASCVLMFAMQRQEFPVDTHIRRLAGLLGWMPMGSNPERTYDVLNAALPDDIKYDLHVLLIEHGRKTCKAIKPRCDDCPITEKCLFYNRPVIPKEEDSLSSL